MNPSDYKPIVDQAIARGWIRKPGLPVPDSAKIAEQLALKEKRQVLMKAAQAQRLKLHEERGRTADLESSRYYSRSKAFE